MQISAPAPTAQGTFAKTPFPHLLVYALEQRLSGTFELSLEGASLATILVIQGFPAKVRLTDEVHRLGEVMQELGLVSEEQLAASLDAMREAPRLQGEILGALGVDARAIEAGLRGQIERKLEHLFSLPPETVFAYFDGVDALARFGGAPTPHDPLAALWRGVRQKPSWEHVDATLRRIGAHAVRIAATAQLERFQFARGEAAAVEMLRQRPLRVVDLANAKVVGPSVAQLLVYCLVITKQVELVETPSMQAPAQPIPPNSQAFARVQLQARPVQRQPLVVEEVAHPRGADGRVSSPLPQPVSPEIAQATQIAVAREGEDDIASMITSSLPPPGAVGSPDTVPLAAPLPEIVAPGSDPQVASAALTAEEAELKSRILERAASISAQNYFQMLGLERDASLESVQKTFIALAKVWHPDRLPGALIDVKDACSKVFSHITEAHAVLSDERRRKDYMLLLKDGGATPDDQAIIAAILEAATEFQKSEFHLKRNDVVQAYACAKKAHTLDPQQADYLAMVNWLEAQRPEWLGREKTLEKIAVFDRCIKMNPNCHRAFFWRGLLFKRIEEGKKAVADFRKVTELDPRNLDAMREVRLYQMRGGTKPPPAPGAPAPSRPSKPPQPEKLGGLFGKLFKK